MKVVFISGPMTGIKNYNRDNFNHSAMLLRRQGYVVFNPAELKEGQTYEWYMQRCLEALPLCTEIHMLCGWSFSDGARLEHATAQKLDLIITGSES